MYNETHSLAPLQDLVVTLVVIDDYKQHTTQPKVGIKSSMHKLLCTITMNTCHVTCCTVSRVLHSGLCRENRILQTTQFLLSEEI